MAAGLTKTALDRMQCGQPGCREPHDALYLHGRCHPDSPTWARYENGSVTVECAAANCGKIIAVIAVAR
jgi:hypothetical protein